MLKKIKSVFTLNMILIILAAVIFNCVFYIFVYTNLVKLTKLYAVNSIDFGTIAVQRSIDEKLNEIEVISKDTFLWSNDISFEKKLEHLANCGEKEDVLRYFIVKPNGDGYSTQQEITYFQKYSFFYEAMKGKTVVAEPIYSDYDKQWVVPSALPIRDNDNNINYVLVAYLSIEDFNDAIDGINLGEKTINLILTKDNLVITTNNKDILNETNSSRILDDKSAVTSSFLEFQKNIGNNDKGVGYFEYKAEKYIAFYKKLNNDWFLISSVPKTVLFSNVYKLSATTTLITVLVVLISLALTIYTRHLNQNLENEKKKNETVLNSTKLFFIELNDKGEILKANKNFLKVIGYNSYEIKKKKLSQLIPENYSDDFKTLFEKILNGINVYEMDIPILTKEKKLISVVWNSNIEEYEQNKRAKKVEIIGTNITKIKDYEKKIQKLAYFDQLTGLNNAVYLEEYFNSLISNNSKNKKHALIFMDLDNFKYINDMFGHEVGDEVIVNISHKLNEIKPDNVLFCRRNGDQFIMLYEDIKNDNDIEEFLENILKTIGEDYMINNLKYNVSSSIAVSIYPQDGETYSELFKSVDIAMNSSKENGKGKITFFNNEMKQDMYDVIMIESDLKRAISNKEFVLYYQPQYDINSGKLCGFEALIRWISPTRGFVSPAKFIPQAEKNQMIIEIGDWALEEACNFINEITELGYDDICISVNVSVVQMLCEDYVEKTLRVLKEKNIKSQNIKLEITETVLMESIDEMLNKINKLNENGIYFALDDFGTGYSSLTYLNRIPLKVLKIDKSFVDIILEKDGNPEIISSIIDLAHDIKLDVVAEGIEENAQLSWLKNKGCNIAQGFYMGKPMPKEKAIEELGNNMYENKKDI